jgi:crotonobetainyl-CoA:carnitine CoA-transferase CaiB-like acyl-CoA transferase
MKGQFRELDAGHNGAARMLGPLNGLIVVDSTWGMPGAVATMLLADYGARVIRVERPGGAPDSASVNRKAWDRGKESVEINLRSSDGLAMLTNILETADIFVESGPPGRAARLGYGYEEIHQRFPRVVYCSISGYGQSGKWSGRPGYEALVAARLGFMAEQPGHRKGPIFLGHPSIGYTTATLADIGILAGLRARRITGLGQHVDVSLLDGILAQTPLNWWWNDRGLSYLGRRDGPTVFGRQRLITDLFRCSDGEYMMIHTGGDGSFKAFMDLIGLGQDIQTIVGRSEASEKLNDSEFESVKAVRSVLAQRTRHEWIELLAASDIAVLPVLRPGEVLHEPQVQSQNGAVTVADPELGKLIQAAPPIAFGDLRPTALAPAPARGSHGQLKPPVHSESSAARPKLIDNTGLSREGALAGLRVLDLSAFFASAYGTKFLSDLGADVIKVESPAKDPMRPLPEPFEGSQRGKRTIAVDLRMARGLDVLHDLVRTADILVHNMRPGKAEALGIAYEQLVKINPRLIYCYQPGFGSVGPFARRKSFAPLLSGYTGLNYQAAGEGNPPVRRARASEDNYAGLLGAIGILIALEHREQSGVGQYLEVSQLCASLWATTEQMLDDAGRLITSFKLDTDQTGYGPLYRLYEARDGWICIAAEGDSAFRKLCIALDCEDLAGDARFVTAQARRSNAESLSSALAGQIAEMNVQQTFDTLDRVGVYCEIARPTPGIPEFFWDEWAFDTGRVYEQHHQEWGWIREVGSVIRLSETPMVSRGPAPLFGEHTRPILAELRYPLTTVEELLAAGACIDRDRLPVTDSAT